MSTSTPTQPSAQLLAIRAAKAEKRLRASVAALDEELCQLSEEWDASPQKENLVSSIKSTILNQQSIQLDSAVCLGLGPIEAGRQEALPEGTASEYRINNDVMDTSNLEVFRPVGKGKKRNKALYQLLVFETVLECLRTKFTISPALFQDPLLGAVDTAFLEPRKHIVIPFPETHDLGAERNLCDPSIKYKITGSTLFFAPSLDTTVVVDVVCSAKPCLYMGNDLLYDLTQPFLRNPGSATLHLLKEFEGFVMSRDFLPIAAFGEKNFSFLWKADMDDEGVAARIQERWIQLDEEKAGSDENIRKVREEIATMRVERAKDREEERARGEGKKKET